MVKIPDRRVFEILLEGHRKAIGDVERAAAHPARAQQHADDALLGVLRNAVVVVDRAEQHERVHDNDEARGRRRGFFSNSLRLAPESGYHNAGCDP